MSFAISSFDYGSPHTQKMEYSGTNVIYIGRADPGTAVTEKRWAIQKFTYDSNNLVTDIQWAGGTKEFKFIWNDRASYTYS